MTTNVTKPADAGPAGAERPDRAHAGVAQATAARSLETAPPGMPLAWHTARPAMPASSRQRPASLQITPRSRKRDE